MMFYEGKEIFDLRDIKVDDGTCIVNVPTPKNWKCKVKNCPFNYKHNHDLFKNLNIS